MSASENRPLELSPTTVDTAPSEIGVLADWDAHLTSIARDAGELQSELARLLEESEALANEITKQAGELEAKEEALVREAEERASADRIRAAAEASLTESRAELGRTRERVASLEQELEQRTAEVSSARTSLARLRTEHDQSREESNNARREANDVLSERSARVTALVHEVQSLRSRIAELEGRETTAVEATPAPQSHLRMIALGTGYSLAECAAPPPEVGEPVELDGRRLRVARVGRSPLPGDGRRCAFLVSEPAPSAHAAKSLPAPLLAGTAP